MDKQTITSTSRKTKKFRKFKREQKETEIPIEIQERDLEILKLVHKYRFLNADHIRALMKTSHKAVSHRLTKLYRAGLLDRPIEQVSLYLRQDFQKSQPLIYALGQRGARVLSENSEGTIDGLDWRRKNKEIKDRTLLHDLGIANFGVILRLAIEQKANDSKLLFWLQDRQDRDKIQDKVVVYNKKKKAEETQTIIPDAVFRIQYPKGRPLFFFEYYREILTNNQRYLEEKLFKYHYYYTQKGHNKKYEATHFRVITMVPNKDRVKNLIGLIKTARMEELDNWKFWFVCEEELVLARPESILDAIFTEAGDGQRHRLLE